MASHSSQRILLLAQTARSIPATDRRRWLEEKCGGDEQLKDAVTALLDESLVKPTDGLDLEQTLTRLFDDGPDFEAPTSQAGEFRNLSANELWFRLDRDGLLSESQIARVRDELGRSEKDDVREIIRRLLHDRHLTPYQAERIVRDDALPLVVNDYVVIRFIGQGGMGSVYMARHRTMKRDVALKMLLPATAKSTASVMRFRREVEAAARLKHPNVVTALDASIADGRPFLVMELVNGHNLSSLVRSEGPLPTEVAIRFIVQASNGLSDAHRREIIHRDVKPSNLLLDDDSGQIKVSDFGLARLLASDDQEFTRTDRSLTDTGNLLGTVDYLAPEQAQNSKDADERADIYSLGCTLYFLLTGAPPFQGDSMMERIEAHIELPAPSLCESRPDVSPKLDAAFQKMVAKSPADRFQNMDEVVSALEACLDERKVVPITTDEPRNLKPLALVGGLGCILTLVVFGSWPHIGWRKQEKRAATTGEISPELLAATDRSSRGAVDAADVASALSTGLIRVGTEPGMVASLADALDRAQAGSVIEIHSNEPQMIPSGGLVWRMGDLTIRAAPGFRPIVASLIGDGVGIAGGMIAFGDDPDQTVVLEGLTIVNHPPEGSEPRHVIGSWCSLTIDRCILVSSSRGVFIAPNDEVNLVIRDSMIASTSNQAGGGSAIGIGLGRLTLENNVLVGSTIRLGGQLGPMSCTLVDNTFVNGRGLSFSDVQGATGIQTTVRRNVYTGLSRLASFNNTPVVQLDELWESVQYMGTGNVFSRNRMKVSWRSLDGHPTAHEDEEQSELELVHKIFAGRQQDVRVADVVFENDATIQLLKDNLLLSPELFVINENAIGAPAGADVTRLPSLPSGLARILPKKVFEYGVSVEP